MRSSRPSTRSPTETAASAARSSMSCFAGVAERAGRVLDRGRDLRVRGESGERCRTARSDDAQPKVVRVRLAGPAVRERREERGHEDRRKDLDDAARDASRRDGHRTAADPSQSREIVSVVARNFEAAGVGAGERRRPNPLENGPDIKNRSTSLAFVPGSADANDPVDARGDGTWLEPRDLGANECGGVRRRVHDRPGARRNIFRSAVEEDDACRASGGGETDVDAQGPQTLGRR